MIKKYLFQVIILFIVLVASHHVNGDDTEEDDTCEQRYTLPSGVTKTCIESTAYDGQRCFYTYTPECAGVDSPLVFNLHGFLSCPAELFTYSGWNIKADENCFVLVLPHGNINPEVAGSCWAVPGGLEDETVDDFTSNGCCCTEPGSIIPLEPSDTDDTIFLRQVASRVVQDVDKSTSSSVTIDTKRIYFAGHSNGCFMSTYMAAVASDMVAAVACHAGGALASIPDSYSPTPIWMVHGTRDIIIDYNGNFLFRGQRSTHEILANKNGCTETDEIFDDSTSNSYSILTSSSCTNNATVVLVTIDNADHIPYLGVSQTGDLIGKELVLDTTQMAWDFVKSYSLNDPPDLSGFYTEDEDDESSGPSVFELVMMAVGGVMAIVAMAFVFFSI